MLLGLRLIQKETTEGDASCPCYNEENNRERDTSLETRQAKGLLFLLTEVIKEVGIIGHLLQETPKDGLALLPFFSIKEYLNK